MDDFFAALRAGKPYNEADRGAESTLTAIMGRMATYSGQVIRWDMALNSKLDLAPKTLAWDADTPVKPRPTAPIPVPCPARRSPGKLTAGSTQRFLRRLLEDLPARSSSGLRASGNQVNQPSRARLATPPKR